MKNKILPRNFVSGKSRSGSGFSGKTEEVRIFWKPPRPPLRLEILLWPLLKAEQGAGEGFSLHCCIVIVPNKLLDSSMLMLSLDLLLCTDCWEES